MSCNPATCVDIGRPLPETHTTFEAGYKGIIANRLQLSVDLWHEKRENFVGPLQLETPLVFLNGDGSRLLSCGRSSPAFPDDWSAGRCRRTGRGPSRRLTAGRQPDRCRNPAAPAGCPIGVVNFNTPNAGNDVIVAYRSYQKSINLIGSDLGAEFLLDGGFSLQGTYSWVNKKLFSKADLGTREDVSLNAPANKHSFAVNYRDEAKGMSAELRERHVDGFNTLAFVGGPVGSLHAR